MIVSELIAALEKLPPDLPVRVGTYDDDGRVIEARFCDRLTMHGAVFGPHVRLEWRPLAESPDSDVGGEDPRGV